MLCTSKSAHEDVFYTAGGNVLYKLYSRYTWNATGSLDVLTYLPGITRSLKILCAFCMKYFCQNLIHDMKAQIPLFIFLYSFFFGDHVTRNLWKQFQNLWTFFFQRLTYLPVNPPVRSPGVLHNPVGLSRFSGIVAHSQH